ncbi:MAG TPA: outer membrane lipid asymmetry maintenance protein MlaD [Spongiibacteraceae bacterium]|nr:outer membrane lipid asymmetry maintenance protein MlaD [Spongiibacteraceae bacterium]
MRMRTIEISVGAFMLAGILALGFLAIQVSGLSIHDSNRDTYRLYAKFTNASGLAVRAKVAIAGVVVGRVTAITLDPTDTRAKVEMAIQKNVDYITSDSIASIQTAGILGEKYISISIGGDPEVLKNGGEIVDTQSALVLEDLISKVLTSIGSKKD